MKTRSFILAASAAALFVSGGSATADHHEGAEGAEANVKCEGANACKGQGACGGAENSCAGQNSCKGKGFVKLSQAECDEAKAND
jgi:hypothetical protein